MSTKTYDIRTPHDGPARPSRRRRSRTQPRRRVHPMTGPPSPRPPSCPGSTTSRTEWFPLSRRSRRWSGGRTETRSSGPAFQRYPRRPVSTGPPYPRPTRTPTRRPPRRRTCRRARRIRSASSQTPARFSTNRCRRRSRTPRPFVWASRRSTSRRPAVTTRYRYCTTRRPPRTPHRRRPP